MTKFGHAELKEPKLLPTVVGKEFNSNVFGKKALSNAQSVNWPIDGFYIKNWQDLESI